MYTLTKGSSIIRDTDQAWIPADPLNKDYQNYLAWVALGNTPNPYVPPSVVSSISFLQFMNLFSNTEQAALVNSTDTNMKLFILMASGAGQIYLSNNEVAQGLAYAASINIIANNRIATILSGSPPT